MSYLCCLASGRTRAKQKERLDGGRTSGFIVSVRSSAAGEGEGCVLGFCSDSLRTNLVVAR